MTRRDTTQIDWANATSQYRGTTILINLTYWKPSLDRALDIARRAELEKTLPSSWDITVEPGGLQLVCSLASQLSGEVLFDKVETALGDADDALENGVKVAARLQAELRAEG